MLHNGPTRPVIQNLQIIGKKITAPEILDAPPLQTRDNAEFNISYSDKQHGFSGTNTTGFAEDVNHNIWIASDNGLYRYDGYHYYLYGPKSGVPAMPDLSILYDKQQRLWLASDSGVYYIQHDSLFSLKTNEIDFVKVPSFKVQSDYLNRIWLSTKRNGAICIEGSVIQIFDKRSGLPAEYVNAVYLSKDGNLYIGLREIGMVVISKDNMRWLFRNSKNMKSHSILCFYEDEDGIWAGSFLGGLLRMGKKDTIQYSISGNYNERIFDIKKAPGGGIWLAAYSLALCYFDKTNLVVINEKNGLLNRFPYKLFEDSFENLWISNLQSGFSRVNENILYVQSYDNPAIGLVRKIIPDSNNGKWIITEGKSLLYQKNKETTTLVYTDKNNLQPFSYPLDGVLGNDGNIWTGSYGPGIVSCNGSEYTGYYYTYFPSSSIVRYVKKDNAGNIWFCPNDFGLIRYNNKSFFHYTQKSGLLSNTVTKLFSDENNSIYWTFENGFQRLIDKNIESFFIGNKLFSGQINDLLTVDKQTTILGTNDMGLLIISNKKVYQLTKNSGLSSNKIKTLIRDKKGEIWISSDNGIESFFFDKTSIRNHNIYNQANGSFLKEVETAFLDSIGIPFWSFGDKRLILNPEFLSQNNQKPIFSIGQLFTDTIPIGSGDEIKILPDQKIKINYTTIFWGRENNLLIKYLLISESGDTSFYSPVDKGQITISEILPGKYRFFISAKDNNQTYYSESIEINVTNFWYNTWLFRISLGILILVSIIYYFKQKAKRQIEINSLLESRVLEQTEIIFKEKTELLKSYQVIENQNLEKDALIQEINHRVKNNLQFISAMVEMQMGGTHTKDTIQALLGTSRRIKAMSLVHEMLFYKNELTGISIKKYIHELVENLKEMADNYEQPVTFKLEIEDMYMDSKTAISLGIIISELISNSFKYAFEKHKNPIISIQFSKNTETEMLCLTVSDNGIGIIGEFGSENGLGRRLIDIFSRQTEGTYNIKHSDGFIYTLLFKPNES